MRTAKYRLRAARGRACAEGGEGNATLAPGNTFGEEALHHSAVYGRTITAETDLRLIAFPGNELRRLCRKLPLLDERIRQSPAAARTGTNRRAGRDPVELEAENERLRRFLSDLLVGQRNGPLP